MTEFSSGTEANARTALTCGCIDTTAALGGPDRSCTHFSPEKGLAAGVLAQTCHPVAYGSYCSAWDESTQPECMSENNGQRPAYCALRWCCEQLGSLSSELRRPACRSCRTVRDTPRADVDSVQCRRSPNASDVRASSYFPRVGLFYSYSACGSDEQAWIRHSTVAMWRGRNITVVLKGEDYPSYFKANATCCGATCANPATRPLRESCRLRLPHSHATCEPPRCTLWRALHQLGTAQRRSLHQASPSLVPPPNMVVTV